MARRPEPFFRAGRGWYVQLGTRQIKLAPGPESPAAKAAAWDAFYALMAAKPAPAPAAKSATSAAGGPAVAEVCDKFLDWCQRHRSPRTYAFYRERIQSFLDTLPDAAGMPADGLKPYHVGDWIDGKPTWGAMQRRGAIVSVKRAFAWAEKVGHVAKSPIRHVEKPQAVRREQVLTRAEFDGLLARVTGPAFRDVLEFCWETGCRVQEVRLIGARHVNAGRGRIELPPAEAKGKKRWRFIYLTPAALAIATRLAAGHPSGPVFRNERGRPWTAQAFNNRFCRLQHRLGREELAREGAAVDDDAVAALAATLPKTRRAKGRPVAKTPGELLREARKKASRRLAAGRGTKYALTAIRHSYATRLLESGVDHITVAALMGHVDGTMLAKVYSHVGDRGDYLRDELLKAAQ